jgi:LytS/YehU family sensor histidine kinase
MLLQTVVENAIKHGIADLPQGGTLRIRARLVAGNLILEVENPRAHASAQHPPQTGPEGVGLRNAAERLRLLFGPDATLALDLSEPAHAAARIRLPIRA